MIKLVIFDFDGTLGDTKEMIVKAMRMAESQYGWILPSDRECEAIIGLPLREGFRQIFPGITDEEVDGRCRDYRQYFMENCSTLVPKAFPHVEETLAGLKARGIRMTMASSRHRESLVQYLEGMKLSDYFELLVGPEDVEKGKPNPDPVLRTLELTGCAADEALVVGDTSYDILMGVRAGVHTCGVSYGVGTPDQLFAAGAGHVTDDISGILRLIQG